MHLDIDERQFSQSQVSECTSVDARTVENYVNYGYLHPVKDGNRRRFSLYDLLQAEFVFRLAAFGIAPRSGYHMSVVILYREKPHLAGDARAISLDPSWVRRTSRRVQLDIARADDGSARFLKEGENDEHAVTIIFPSGIFARTVMQNAARALGAVD